MTRRTLTLFVTLGAILSAGEPSSWARGVARAPLDARGFTREAIKAFGAKGTVWAHPVSGDAYVTVSDDPHGQQVDHATALVLIEAARRTRLPFIRPRADATAAFEREVARQPAGTDIPAATGRWRSLAASGGALHDVFSQPLDARYPVDPKALGGGWEKEAFSVAQRRDRVARVLRPQGKHSGRLSWDPVRLEHLVLEYATAEALRDEWDVPVLLPRRTGRFFTADGRGRPGDVLDAYEMEFKDADHLDRHDQRQQLLRLLRRIDIQPHLQRIQRAFDAGLILGDFQLLIGARTSGADELAVFDSRFLSDPGERAEWKKRQQSRLDSLKQLAKEAAASR